MGEWATLDDYITEHRNLITAICRLSVDDWEPVADLALDLWLKTRSKVNRSPVSHCFDCVYIIAYCTGNKTSIGYLSYIGQVLLNRNVQAMQTNRDKKEQRWFMTDWGKAAIIEVIKDESLYDDCMVWWNDEEE